MALKLTATYSKRLGLPGYSSHQFSVTVEAEVTNIDAVAGESANLYRRLQDAVDGEIRHAGYVPGQNGGGGALHSPQNGSTHRNGNGRQVLLGNGSGDHAGGSSFLGKWQCTPKQQSLILQLVDENHLDKLQIENYAIEHFCGKGVKELGKTEASELIEYMFSLGTPTAFGARRVRKDAI